MICDRSYMPLQTGWREQLAREAGCTVVRVETEVVVPVDVVSASRNMRRSARRFNGQDGISCRLMRPGQRPPPA